MNKFMKSKKFKIVLSILIVLIVGTTVKLVSDYNKKQEILKTEQRIAAEKAIEESKAREKAKKELAESRETKVKLNETITPDTILNGGMIASKAKELIEIQRVFCYKEGMSEEETRKFLSDMAERDFGITLAALESLEINEQPIASNPDTPVSNGDVATQNGGNENGNGISPQFEGYQSGTGTITTTQNPNFNLTPAGESTEWDKNGNGINDEFEDVMLTGEGSSEGNPDFILYMPGEEPND